MKAGIPKHHGSEGSTNMQKSPNRQAADPYGGPGTGAGYCKSKYGGNGITGKNSVRVGNVQSSGS